MHEDEGRKDVIDVL